MNTLALFASGSGSNVENIYKYFVGNDKVKVGLVLTDNQNAYVIERAKKLNIPYIYFTTSTDFYSLTFDNWQNWPNFAKLGLMMAEHNFTFFKNLLFGVENCDFEILTLSENMVFLQ